METKSEDSAVSRGGAGRGEVVCISPLERNARVGVYDETQMRDD